MEPTLFAGIVTELYALSPTVFQPEVLALSGIPDRIVLSVGNGHRALSADEAEALGAVLLDTVQEIRRVG